MLGQGGRVPSSPGQGDSSCAHSPSELGESLVLVEPSAAVSDTEGWVGSGRSHWALLSPQSFWSSDPSLRPPQSVDCSLSPCCSSVPSTPRLSNLLPPEPFPGHRITPPSPSAPDPHTSAAEAKGEQGQEGQHDEGLHGAFLCWAERSPGSLGVFIGSCGPGKGGNGLMGYLQHIHCGRSCQQRQQLWFGTNLVPPVPSQSPQREGKVAPGQGGLGGGPSPASLAAPSPHWNG